MRLTILSLVAAVFGLASANATTLQFYATTNTGETASFILDTTVPNTYSPTLYPPPILPVCACGVYLGAVQDLKFEGTDIALSDVVTQPGETGNGNAITVMDVGPLFDGASLSLELIFLDPTLVKPLNSDPLEYEQSFDPNSTSVLFPATPPPRTNVDSITSLTVSEVSEPSPIPEPSYGVLIAVIALCTVVLRRFGMCANRALSN